ncbi:invasion associated locus B family protein [Afifella pfennigii]|uniref:invasion associated locus B family protein n=1 Tax=Afifella pfennigii TaxID=209897 RepID=UPI00047E5888|nr:invasion associated locus B family protein [Afifella pfennigii]
MHVTKAATVSNRSIARIAATLLLAFAVSPALAQDQQGQEGADQAAPKQPDWVKLCSENPQNKQEVCVVTRERRAATGQLLAAVSLRETEGKRFLVSAVPPGMLIRPGLQVQIDGGEPTKVQYSICFPNLCFAETEVQDDFIASMKKGSKLVITTLNQQAKPVNFDLSLAGFTASYDGPAIDPQELQAEQQKLEDELKRKAEEARKQLIQRQQQSTGQQ